MTGDAAMPGSGVPDPGVPDSGMPDSGTPGPGMQDPGTPGLWTSEAAAAMSGTAIRIEGLRKAFGTNEVLKGIDLTVSTHEVICLIGASGSGKSTLLRCLNLLEPINAGRISLWGQEITAAGIDQNLVRRSIGIVFQSYNLFPHMSVLQNVTLAPRKALGTPRLQAEEEARALLSRFGLLDKEAEFPDRLSGGQQQRAAIVRALAMRPQIMLLDEVTSALDPELVAEVLDVIRELAASGMTMLIATHEMGFARDIARRVCFLEEGRIIEDAPPAELFTAPKDERTQRFLRRIIAAGRL
jgi:polar amino acid transport system ATP-binding protein